MADIPVHVLRSQTREVLHRVEVGERLTVTVNGRRVAQLVPLSRRPRFLPWQQVLAHQADPGLADDLRDMLHDTTDDVAPHHEKRPE